MTSSIFLADSTQRIINLSFILWICFFWSNFWLGRGIQYKSVKLKLLRTCSIYKNAKLSTVLDTIYIRIEYIKYFHNKFNCLWMTVNMTCLKNNAKLALLFWCQQYTFSFILYHPPNTLSVCYSFWFLKSVSIIKHVFVAFLWKQEDHLFCFQPF